MKTTLKAVVASLLLVFGSAAAVAHGKVEHGPNGGRILEFSKDESMHGEVTVKDGRFHIGLFDKAMKPVPIAEQSVTVTSGDRNKPEKLPVQKADNHFVSPVVKEGEWVIIQFRENANAKPITARFEYDTVKCATCKFQEWLCNCTAETETKKK